ncbi:endonuclease VII domain-containing protein [Glutamicibacter creatinolyticus]|uniref:endonuclease VII domain-containing protein n=1 Tax=Glutamicibacter creatinolyticus TaxID=162496 RepID=UPI003CD08A75
MELSESQDHKCAICGDPYGMESLKHPLYVDHCHQTGKVRGLLCSRCNTGLGLFRDSPDLMLAAVTYLTRSSSGVTSMKSSDSLNELSVNRA